MAMVPEITDSVNLTLETTPCSVLEGPTTTASDVQSSRRHPPSLFTDNVGNLKFVNLVVRHPYKIFFFILLLTLAMSSVFFHLIINRTNPFSDPGTQNDPRDVRSIARDSLTLAVEDVKNARESRPTQDPNEDTSARIQEEYLDFTYWVYEAKADDSKGVFGSAESIRAMKESHSLILEDAGYESYCWRQYKTVVNRDDNTTTVTSECRPPFSPLNAFYASYWDETVADLIIKELQDPYNVKRYNDLALCVEINFRCDSVNNETSIYTDDDFAWARQLNAYILLLASFWDGKGDLLEENLGQVTLLIAHLMQLETKQGLINFGFDNRFSLNSTVSRYTRAVFLWGGPLNETLTTNRKDKEGGEKLEDDSDFLRDYVEENLLPAMNEIANTDRNSHVNSSYFMGVLIESVLLDIAIRDALLAFVSFGFIFLYLRFTVGSWFLAIVGMTEIVLSVPATYFIYDVILRIKFLSVLNALSLFIVAAIGADDIFIFMDAYKQSCHSDDPNVLESLESRMSWVYRRTGTAMAITSATTCAAFLSTLISPLVGIRSFGIFTAIVIFIDYILVMTLFCTAVVIFHNKFERPGFCSSCTGGCRTEVPSPTGKAFDSIGHGKENDGDRVGQFFRNRVSAFMKKGVNRAVIGVVFLAWVAVAVYSTTRLEPTRKAEQFLDDDHPLQKSATILNTEFRNVDDDPATEVYFVWGLDDVDRDDVNLLQDPDFRGTPRYADLFEFNERCQTALFQACLSLRTNDDYQPHIKQKAGLGTVHCFVEELGAYSVLGSLVNCLDVKQGAWQQEGWQVSVEDIPSLMAGFLQQRSCFSEEGQTILDYYGKVLGWDGNRVRFAGVSLESSIIDPFSTLPEATVRSEYEKMIDISGDLSGAVTDACVAGNVVMTDLDNKFIFMNNQSIFTTSAWQNSLLGIGIAFVVLLFATRIFHIALFATLSIACVLMSVAGMMVLIGWKLGSVESVLISIVAGFSVDYVVHLAHSYSQARGNTFERMATAFGEMGISVFNGMVTSVGASIPLFFCQLTFFQKFGTFMLLTILFSWLFANFGFMSLLAQLQLPIKGGKEKAKLVHRNDEDARAPLEELSSIRSSEKALVNDVTVRKRSGSEASA